MALQRQLNRVRIALWCRMAFAVALLLLALLVLVALEAALLAVASAALLIVPYLAATVVLENPPLALVGTTVVYAGLVFALGCAARAMGADDHSETAVNAVTGAYVVVVLSSLAAVGYTVVEILSYSVEAAVLLCGVLVAGGYVSGLFFMADSWSNTDAEDRSVDFSAHLDSDDGDDSDTVGIQTEMRRVLEEFHHTAGLREYLLAVTATVAALGAVYTGATAIPRFYHLPALAAAGSFCLVGAQVGATARSEVTGDTAVLRNLEHTVGFDGTQTTGSDSERTSEAEREDRERQSLQRIVDRLAAQVAVPAPEVRVGSSATPTAVTAGYRPATSTIVVSRGLLEELEDRELEAVLAHELAHVINRDAAVMTFLAVPGANANAAIVRHVINPVVAIPAAVAYAVSRWCIAVVSSTREYAADDGAVAITGDPAALASALEKLDAELERRPSSDLRESRSTAAFSIVPPPWEEHRFFDRTRRFVNRRIFGTHPPTEKRIERLRTRA
ncbi:M48 family metalloprotease [Halopiger thermotolerans]